MFRQPPCSASKPACDCPATLTARPYIPPILIQVNKLAQSLDDIDILPRPRDNQLASLMQAVIQHLQTLEHVSPVLALVVEPLVEHVHDLVEIGGAVAGALAVSLEGANSTKAEGGIVEETE